MKDMDPDGLRRAIRRSLDDGDFALSYLWIKFWDKNGYASRVCLNAFVHDSQELSETDLLVLGAVFKELRQCTSPGDNSKDCPLEADR